MFQEKKLYLSSRPTPGSPSQAQERMYLQFPLTVTIFYICFFLICTLLYYFSPLDPNAIWSITYITKKTLIQIASVKN